jgi:hypothetical protein
VAKSAIAPAGTRDVLVTIQGLTETTGDTGYPIETFTDRPPKVWMSKTMDTAAERLAGAQIAARFFTEWTMPYRSDMDPDRVDVPKLRRLKLHERTHDIIAAELIGQHRQIRLVTLASTRIEVLP